VAKSSHSPASTSCCLIHLLKGSSAIPSGYLGDYFFADFCSGWIRTYDPSTKSATGFATGLSSVVDLEVSKNEGELYYLSRGSPGSVSKIGYTGNQAP
jgi:hypothetical protein